MPWKCTKCYKTNPDNTTKCIYCSNKSINSNNSNELTCSKCYKKIPSDVHYCPHCGSSVINIDDVKSSSNISLAWIKSILETLPLINILPPEEPDEIRTFIPSLNMYIIIKIRIDTFISFQSFFRIEKKFIWGRREKLLNAINNANYGHFLLNFILSDTLDIVYINSYIYLSHSISAIDIGKFLFMFITHVPEIIANNFLEL
jgi:hypothetical protein